MPPDARENWHKYETNLAGTPLSWQGLCVHGQRLVTWRASQGLSTSHDDCGCPSP